LFGHLWEVELTYRYIFAFKFTLRSQQPDIVPIICHWWCYWHRWQIATIVVDTGGKFAIGINNTSLNVASSQWAAVFWFLLDALFSTSSL